MTKTTITNAFDLSVPPALDMFPEATSALWERLRTGLASPRRMEAELQAAGVPIAHPVQDLTQNGFTAQLYKTNHSQYGFPHKESFTLLEVPNPLMQLCLRQQKKYVLPSVWLWLLRCNYATPSPFYLDSQGQLNGYSLYPVLPALNHRIMHLNMSIERRIGDNVRFACIAKGSYFLAVRGTHAEVVGLGKKVFKNMNFTATEYAAYLFGNLNFVCFQTDGSQYQPVRGVDLWDESYLAAAQNDVLAWARQRKLHLLVR